MIKYLLNEVIIINFNLVLLSLYQYSRIKTCNPKSKNHDTIQFKTQSIIISFHSII